MHLVRVDLSYKHFVLTISTPDHGRVWLELIITLNN